MIKILVADDEENYRDILQRFLVQAGYEVILAMNGQEAYDKIMKENPDMAILDVNMPFMTGFEVCEKIRSLAPTKKIPVMILTVLSDVNTQVQGYQLGADDYLAKPFNMKVLIARLKTLERRILNQKKEP